MLRNCGANVVTRINFILFQPGMMAKCLKVLFDLPFPVTHMVAHYYP